MTHMIRDWFYKSVAERESERETHIDPHVLSKTDIL